MRSKTHDSYRLEAGIHIRLTALEKKLLSDRCKREDYLMTSDFGKAKLLKRREIKKIESGKEFISLVCKTDYELNKIGVNLNQIAKKINIHDIYQFTSADPEVLFIWHCGTSSQLLITPELVFNVCSFHQ